MLYLKGNNNDNNIVTVLLNVLYFHHMISNLFIEFYFMSDATVWEVRGIRVDNEFNFHRKVMVRRS